MLEGIRSSELRHLAAAWSSATPMIVAEARMPDPGLLFLRTDLGWWRIEVRPFAHLRRASTPPRNPRNPHSFQGLLRARLPATLTDVQWFEGERRIKLIFSSGDLEIWFFGHGKMIWREQGRAIAGSDGPVAADLTAPPPSAAAGAPSRIRSTHAWEDAGELYPKLAAQAAAEQRQEAHRHAVRRQRAAWQRKLDAMERDLERAKGAGRLRDETDLLAAFAHTVPHGAREVILEDLHNGHPTTLSLDPTRPIRSQIAARYARAARLTAATDGIARRIAEVREALSRLDDPGVGPVNTGAKANPTLPYWRWCGPRGGVLLVSRDRHSAVAVLRDASPRDTWFHLRDRASPHVILRTSGPPDAAACRAAIEVLLATARVGTGDDVVVQRARRCDLRPIKGHPGKVRVDREVTSLERRDVDALRGWRREKASADDEP